MRIRPCLFLLLASIAALTRAQVSSLDPNQDIRNLIALNQIPAAEKLVVSRLATQPHDADLITCLAEVRLNQRHPEEALRLVQNAEEVGGPTALRSQIAGLAETAQGRLASAEKHFRQAIELDPKFVPAHYYLARLLYTRNRFDEAIAESKATIALSPEFVRAYENLGLSYEGKDDSKQAEQWYREAARRNSDTSNKTEWPLLDLATLLVKQDRLNEAHPFLEQAIEINPNNPQAHLQMGILLEKSGASQRSLEELRSAIRLDKNLSSALYRAARVCQKLGRQEEAQHYFSEYRKATENQNK